MKNKLKVWYDKEADYLEIRTVNGKSKTSFEEIGDTEIFNEVDEKTGKKVGVAIFGFSKRFSKPGEISVELPFEVKELEAA